MNQYISILNILEDQECHQLILVFIAMYSQQLSNYFTIRHFFRVGIFELTG